MWDKWFRQWLEAIFWWLPNKERDEQASPDAPKQEETADQRREEPQSYEATAPEPEPLDEPPAAQPVKPEAEAEAPKQPGDETVAKPQRSRAKTDSSKTRAKSKPDAQSDDLTAIKGLGPVMQRKLAEIGITSFKHLAEADAQTLTDQLKPSQRTVTKEKVEGWQSEAQKLQKS